MSNAKFGQMGGRGYQTKDLDQVGEIRPHASCIYGRSAIGVMCCCHRKGLKVLCGVENLMVALMRMRTNSRRRTSRCRQMVSRRHFVADGPYHIPEIGEKFVKPGVVKQGTFGHLVLSRWKPSTLVWGMVQRSPE